MGMFRRKKPKTDGRGVRGTHPQMVIRDEIQSWDPKPHQHIVVHNVLVSHPRYYDPGFPGYYTYGYPGYNPMAELLFIESAILNSNDYAGPACGDVVTDPDTVQQLVDAPMDCSAATYGTGDSYVPASDGGPPADAPSAPADTAPDPSSSSYSDPAPSYSDPAPSYDSSPSSYDSGSSSYDSGSSSYDSGSSGGGGGDW